MKNLKVRSKLMLSFGIVLALLFVTVFVGVTQVRSIGSTFDVFASQVYVVRGALNRLNTKLYTLQARGYQQVATGDHSDAMYSQILDAVQGMQTEIDSVIAVNGETTGLSRLRSNVSTIDGLVRQLQAGTMDTPTALGQIEPLLLEMETSVDEMIAQVATNAETMISKIDSQVTMTIYITLGVGVAAAIISVFVCLVLTKQITVPLHQMQQATGSIQQGNLKINVDYVSKDEFGMVADSMRDMATTLDSYVTDITHEMEALADGDLTRKMTADFRGQFIGMAQNINAAIDAFDKVLSQITSAADQVSSGADQTSSGAQALAQGATEQASSVEELAATINEISSQVSESAENAQLASEKVSNVGNEMTVSNQKMQEMVAAMNEISQCSSEIGKIIKTIEDIAFQTNILALNAAVEAARAGAAGKGFAVVADEVRNLASKSAEASANTSALIENTLKAVQNGTNIAGDTAQSLTVAVEGAEEVVEVVGKISRASASQADAVSQVTIGIDQISSVVQTNSATAEESAAASEQLSGQAQMLKDLVSEFKLKDSVHSNTSYHEEPSVPAGGEFNDFMMNGSGKY